MGVSAEIWFGISLMTTDGEHLWCSFLPPCHLYSTLLGNFSVVIIFLVLSCKIKRNLNANSFSAKCTVNFPYCGSLLIFLGVSLKSGHFKVWWNPLHPFLILSFSFLGCVWGIRVKLASRLPRSYPVLASRSFVLLIFVFESSFRIILN